MHGTFLQKVVLTLVVALFASGVIEAWKWTVKVNDDVNGPQNWRRDPISGALPPRH
jgi:hypothetical protein